MRRLFLRCAAASALASLPLFVPALSGAQTAAAVEHSARVAGMVDAGQTVRLSGHVPVYADGNRVPSTAMASNAQFAHMGVLLSRSPAVEASFEQLLADEVNPASPRFHQWLTPAQVGTLYGPAQADVDAVTAWLQSQGLTVNSVSPNRLAIDFGGPVASVERAFGTSFRIFSLANGEQRYSLTQEPTVPAALQPVIANIAGLSEMIHHSNAVHHSLAPAASQGSGLASPQYTTSSGSYHYLVAGDFNAIYDVTSTLSAGVTGSGQNIAVIGESRVYGTDISQLETMEGIPTTLPNVIIPPSGTDPGMTSDDAQGEATLDVDRTLGTAPGSTVDLVVSGNVGSGNTYATDGLFIALSYAISTVNDPILSISFGGCEALDTAANVNYEASYFTTAASQGITTFVSSGDNGAAGCNFDYSTIPTNQVLSINDLCSSQYVTCVGGTEFAADVSSPTTYWNTSNSSTFSSALGYIPEGVWNDPYLYQGNYDESAGGGGGTSTVIARPSWQTGTGVPAGSFRLVPDVSFTSSANHDGYIVCLNYASDACVYSGTTITNAAVFGGTSAAAPSMAGIQALINQKLGGRQGNVNPTIYSLANSGIGFNDVTVASSGVSNCVVTTPSLCNNSTPAYSTLTGGLSGYVVTAGYDEATGWGSMDVGKFLAAAANTFTIVPASSTLTVSSANGSSVTDSIAVSSTNSFAGAVALTCTVTNASGTAAGTCTLSSNSSTLTAGSSSTTTLTVTPTAGTSGTLNVSVTGTSGSTVVTSSTVTVTVQTANFTLTPAATTLNLLYNSGASVTDNVVVASGAGFAGNVALTCSVAATGGVTGTCSLAPTAVALTSGSSSNSVLTITGSSQGVAGTLTVTVTGTSGSLTSTATAIVVTVGPPSFTISPSATKVTVNSNSGSTATDPLTITSVNTLSGSVALGCTVTNGTASGTCAITPASVTLANGGTAASVLTITPTVGSAGTFTVALTGSSGSTGPAVTPPTITVTVNAPSFTIAAAPSSLSFTGGATTGNTSTITVASINSFTGSVSLTCSLTSSTAFYQPTCTIAPTSVTLAANGSTTATLTIGSTTAVTTSGSAAVQGQFAARSEWTLGGGATLALLVFCAPLARRRRKLAAVTLAGMLAISLSVLSGCSSSSGTTLPVTHSSAGTYTATITATGTTTGGSTASSQTTTVSVTVN